MPGYVAYTNGLLVSEARPDGVPSGEAVRASDFNDEEWTYHLAHGNVVRAGGPHDPNVLAAAAEEEIPEDPRDVRIRELQEQLDLARGQLHVPYSGADAVAEEAAKKEEAPQAPRSQRRPAE
jgi:hypothetical protein